MNLSATKTILVCVCVLFICSHGCCIFQLNLITYIYVYRCHCLGFDWILRFSLMFSLEIFVVTVKLPDILIQRREREREKTGKEVGRYQCKRADNQLAHANGACPFYSFSYVHLCLLVKLCVYNSDPASFGRKFT